MFAICRRFVIIVRAAPRKQDTPENDAGCVVEFMQNPLENVVFSVLATTAVGRNKELWQRADMLSKID